MATLPTPGRSILRNSATVCFLFLVPPAFLLAALPTIASGEDSDATLIRTVQDGLEQSLSAYPNGEATFEISYFKQTRAKGASAATPTPVKLAGTVRWSRHGTRWDVTDPGAPPEEHQSRTVLLTERRLTRYNHGRGEVTVRDLNRPEIARSLLYATYFVRPADCWFHLPDGRSWADILRHVHEEPFLYNSGGNSAALSAKLDGIVVSLHVGHPDRGGYQAEVSLDAPVRVNRQSVRHATEQSVPPARFEATWKANEDGVSYPAELFARSAQFTADFVIVEEKTLTIKAFDTTFSPDPPAAFGLDALELPHGTKIIYLGTDGKPARERYVGGKPTKQDELDALSDELKAGAFAGGKETN